MHRNSFMVHKSKTYLFLLCKKIMWKISKSNTNYWNPQITPRCSTLCFIRRIFLHQQSSSTGFGRGMLIPFCPCDDSEEVANFFISIKFRMLLLSGFLSHLSLLLLQLIFFRGCWWVVLVSFSNLTLILYLL